MVFNETVCHITIYHGILRAHILEIGVVENLGITYLSDEFHVEGACNTEFQSCLNAIVCLLHVCERHVCE